MPALPPYIPRKQADLAGWLNNFSTLISAAPCQYGLLASDAADIAQVNAAWQAAYQPVTSPATKTAQTVAAKDMATVVTLARIRPYAQRIAGTPGVSGDNKVALGLNPRTSPPAPITPPSTCPSLAVQSASSLALILRFRDSAASVSVKAKPYGVMQLRLYGMTSPTPISDRRSLPLLTTLTKSPSLLALPASAGGQQLYMAGQWATRTGGLSPYSSIISYTVPM